MHPQIRSWSALHVCWKCQWRITSQQRRLGLAHPTAATSATAVAAGRRGLHSTRLRRQLATSTADQPPAFDPALHAQSLPIRERLKLKQEELGGPDEETLSAFGNYPTGNEMINGMSKLSYGAKADESIRGIEEEGDEDLGVDDLITIGIFLKPGDVVELSMPGREPVLAVFVQQLGVMSQFFSVNGKWCHTRLSTVSFAIPGAMDPTLVQRLIPYMPTDVYKADPKGDVRVPREAVLPIIELLETITEEAERTYRQNAPVLDTAYSVLADKTRTRMMTLNQIAKTLLEKHDGAWKPSPAALLAVRKALLHNEFRFGSDHRSQRLTNVFAIRPINDVQAIETVQDWVREYNEDQVLLLASVGRRGEKASQRLSAGGQNIAKFVEKARRLIATSRQQREPNNGFVGPSKTTFPISDNSLATRTTYGEEFNSADKQIITFMQSWVLQSQFTKMSSFYACCVSILRATGCYEGETRPVQLPGQGLDKERIYVPSGHLFLQEIGVLTPYEDRSIYDEQLMLPSVRLSRNLELLVTKAELTRRSPDFRDSMAGLRRDWSATTVFCIDGEGAKEIDDGISIESVSGKESEFWVHVHVANPTAFFNKTHVLSGLAAHMTESVYTPQGAFPMLPKWASEDYFSLDRDRPVLTFSTKIDLQGHVLETKIQPGIIRNIISITPEEVSEYLGEKSKDVVSETIIVGGEAPSTAVSRARPELAPGEIQELRQLYSAALSMWKMRKAAGGIKIGAGEVNVRLFEKSGAPGIAWTPPSVERARTILGNPIIEVVAHAAQGSAQQEINSSNITEETMLLACQTAASWCGERNIPAMYRGTIETPDATGQSLEQFQEQVVFPALQKHGSISRGLGYRYLKALGRSIAHSSPLPHRMIGTKAYLKVTSPLRRFSDMIAHWQIEAALRYEARTGNKFDANAMTTADRPVLPFSREQMQESIITLSPREKIIAGTKKQSAQFWVVLAFMRAFYYKEATLPKTFKIWVRDVREGPQVAPGLLSDYSINCNILRVPGQELEVGDEWEAKIYSVDVYHRSIFMEPIRLLQREDVTA